VTQTTIPWIGFLEFHTDICILIHRQQRKGRQLQAARVGNQGIGQALVAARPVITVVLRIPFRGISFMHIQVEIDLLLHNQRNDGVRQLFGTRTIGLAGVGAVQVA